MSINILVEYMFVVSFQHDPIMYLCCSFYVFCATFVAAKAVWHMRIIWDMCDDDVRGGTMFCHR